MGCHSLGHKCCQCTCCLNRGFHLGSLEKQVSFTGCAKCATVNWCHKRPNLKVPLPSWLKGPENLVYKYYMSKVRTGLVISHNVLSVFVALCVIFTMVVKWAGLHWEMVMLHFYLHQSRSNNISIKIWWHLWCLL